MPFGLTNVPSVLQRLMQQVLAGLNQEDSPSFVEVYIDDILVFSRTWEDHLQHLQLVIRKDTGSWTQTQARKMSFPLTRSGVLGICSNPRRCETKS